MENSFDISNSRQNELFILAKEGDKAALFKLLEHCKNICLPIKRIYQNYAYRFGVSENEMDSCVYDALYSLLNSEIKEFTNFDSYFRKRYEFYLSNYIRSYRSYYSKHLSIEKSSPSEEAIEDLASTECLKSRELAKYVDENRQLFSYSEVGVLSYLILGFSLNEIAKEMNCSYTRIKRIYTNLSQKIKKINKFDS